MPPVSRLGDLGTGHGCYPPTTISSASGDVYTNSIGTARKDDSLIPHACPDTPPHGRAIKSGSSSVFVNSRDCTRIGDPIDCGGNVAEGSGNVFAGG